MRLNNQRGFTLLELLIVIAVLGILAAIAIPQFTAYRDRAFLAATMSNCRALYRAYTIFYLENAQGYPSKVGEGNTDDMNLTTFYPLSDKRWLGGISFEVDIEQLKKSVGGNPADRVYFTDPSYQRFYLVMPWGKDPSMQLVIASSDNVKDKAGNLIDGGNYLDGVFIWKNGQIKYQ